MRVKELMARASISRDTLRFYEKEGLITQPPRGLNGYRDYGEHVLEEIRFIRIAQSVGFPLKEIKRAIPHLASAKPGCPYLQAALEKQLQAVESKITELMAAKGRLQKWLAKNSLAQDGASKDTRDETNADNSRVAPGLMYPGKYSFDAEQENRNTPDQQM